MTLKPIERRILKRLCKGSSPYKIMAPELGLSIASLKANVPNLCCLFGVGHRSGLVGQVLLPLNSPLRGGQEGPREPSWRVRRRLDVVRAQRKAVTPQNTANSD